MISDVLSFMLVVLIHGWQPKYSSFKTSESIRSFYMVLRVIHESHDADRTRSQTKKFFIMVIVRKGKSRGTDLFERTFVLNFFMSWHQEKVELSSGRCRERGLQIMGFLDHVCAGAGIDGERGLMIKAHVGNI